GSTTLTGFIFGINADGNAGSSELGNPDLRWETSTSLYFGVDFGLFDNRISGSVDLYDARTTDLLLNRTIAGTHAVRSVAANLGKLRNRGVELQLTSINVDRGLLRWESQFNLAANRNKIVELY